MNKLIVFISSLVLFSLLCFNVSALSYYVTNPNPNNEETDIGYNSNVETCVDITLPQNCNASMYFYSNNTGVWVEYENYTNIISKDTFCGNFSVVCGTIYYWNVSTMFNCSGSFWWENHTYSFTTSDCPVSHITPSNNSVDNCPCCLAICAKMSNLSGDMIKFAFQSNYTGSWSSLEGDRVAPANETYCLCVPEFVWFNYTYYWRVIYHDGEGVNYSDIFSFTTAIDVSDCPCGESGVSYGDVNSDTVIGIIGIIGIFGIFGFLLNDRRKK